MMSATSSRFLPPENELDEQFILAGGPGGQHVNRTETGVQLRYDALNSDFLPQPVKIRLLELAGRRADTDGVITIEAKNHRSQHRNREEARERLSELIEKAHQRPKKRIPTKPSRSAKKRWKKKKQRRKEIKRARKPPRIDE
jgi:ribosome-associated protein